MNKQLSGIKRKIENNKKLMDYEKETSIQKEKVKELRYENKFLQDSNTNLKHERNDLYIKVDSLNDEIRNLKSKLDKVSQDFEYEQTDNRDLIHDINGLIYKNKRRITNIVERYKIIDNFKNESCSICLEVSGEKIVTDCGHTFHKECLSKVRNKLCPMCRNTISYNLFTFNSNPTKFEYSIV